jgi:hypothetical protein
LASVISTNYDIVDADTYEKVWSSGEEA